jgi:uncharacterized integral membrane protein (TIGR00698 family)
MPIEIAIAAPKGLRNARELPAKMTALAPGVALTASLASLAIVVGQIRWLTVHGMSALTVAIALGIVVGNTFYGRIASHNAAGVGFSKQALLRAGVILYGLRLTLHDVGAVGLPGVIIDALVMSSTFLLARLLGTRVFGLDAATSMLIGSGSAICGAAAVMATEPVVRGKAEQVAVAVATVVLFGTASIFLYPALYHLGLHWALLPATPNTFGIFIGSTVHEVAQVFAAGRSISSKVADTAVITKMVRVMMLAPFLIGLSAWLNRGNGTLGRSEQARPITIPWFALSFIGVTILNSILRLPPAWHAAGAAIDTFLLSMAMAALGLTTHASAIRRAGVRPLLLAAALFGWLVIGGALINLVVNSCLR